MTISELGKKVGIGRETIRFYERKGILPMPQKDTRGYRVYSGEDVKRLQFVRSSKLLGFSLNEISSLISLQESSESICADVKQTVVEKLKLVKQKISQLKKIERALKSLKYSCNTQDKQCAIIKTLEDEKFF